MCSVSSLNCVVFVLSGRVMCSVLLCCVWLRFAAWCCVLLRCGDLLCLFCYVVFCQDALLRLCLFGLGVGAGVSIGVCVFVLGGVVLCWFAFCCVWCCLELFGVVRIVMLCCVVLLCGVALCCGVVYDRVSCCIV